MVLLKALLLTLLQLQCQPDCTVTAPRISTVMAIDGHLAEPEWGLAQPAEGFTQMMPQEGAPATHATEVRILHNGRLLYIGARMHDSEPGRIRSMRGRRDVFDTADRFSVALDTYGDGRTIFLFTVNAGGVRAEGMRVAGMPDHAPNHPMGFDAAWDAEWQANAHVDSAGWTVEMAIPLKVIEVRSRTPAPLGVNFSRFIANRWELNRWAVDSGGNHHLEPAVPSGVLNLTGPIDPGVHRSAEVSLNVFRPGDASESDGVPAIPLPGVEAELAEIPAVFAHVAIMPDPVPETFSEYLRLPFLPGLDQYAPRSMFAAVQQQLSVPAILGNSVFQHPVRSKNSELLLGAAALRGQLPGGITYAGAGLVSTGEFDRFDQGFVGTLRQRIGRGSFVRISTGFGAQGPVWTETLHTDIGRTVEEYATIARAAALDWDLRVAGDALRLTGQAALSGAKELLVDRKVQENRADTRLLVSHETLRQVQASEYGFAGQLQVEQLNRAWNLYGGLSMADSSYRTGAYGRRGMTDRIVIYTGIHHSATALPALLQNLHMTAELAQHHRFGGLGYRETQASVFAALLTRAFSQIVLSLRVTPMAMRPVQLVADVAGSTDLRNRWVARPKAAVHAAGGGAFSWHVSVTASGRLGRAVALDFAGGLEGRRSKASTWDATLPRHLSAAGLSGYRSAATHAYYAAWQAYPRVGFSLPAYDPYGLYTERTTPWRYSFGRAGVRIAVGSRIELEVGAAVRAPVTQGAVQADGRPDIFLRLGWEYKEASRLEFGSFLNWRGTSMAQSIGASLSDLSTLDQEQLYMLRITRKTWR